MYCVDASLVARIITGSMNQEITSLVDQWRLTETVLVAPSLLGYEIANTFHRKRAEGLSDSMIRRALVFLEAMSIQHVDDHLLQFEALGIAKSFGHPASYDAHYLAVAIRYNAEFWTCDRRLFNSVRSRFDWARFADPDA